MITDTKFWKIVEQLDWPHCFGREREEGVRLLRTYTDAELKEIEKHLTYHYYRLAAAIDKAEGKGFSLDLSDDGEHDLLMHVIGLGKKKYQFYLDHPRELGFVDAKESFSYVFPNVHDRKYLSKEPFLAWAKKIYEGYRKSTRLVRIERGLNRLCEGLGTNLVAPISQVYELQMQFLVPVVCNQDLDAVLNAATGFEVNLNSIERRQKRLEEHLAESFLRIKTGVGWPSTTSARNFISDLKVYHGRP